MKKLLLFLGALLVTAPALAQSVTLFSTEVPNTVISGTGQPALNAGVKFTTDVQGQIVGLRYYKHSTETSTSHTLTLWRATSATTGVILRQVATSGETASGWQMVYFKNATTGMPEAVTIVPGQTYVVTVYRVAGQGRSQTPNYFTTNDKIVPPLRAAKTINGVYNNAAGATASTFPSTTSTTQGNFFADVIFIPGFCGVFQ